MSDEPDLGVFGPRPPQPEKRFEEKPGGPRWSILEELVLWPILLPCERGIYYQKTCWWLCTALGREPRCDDERMVKESVALIEMRTVTRHLGGEPEGIIAKAVQLMNGYRSGMTLSWVERHKFLPQWFRKIENGQPRIEAGQLLPLLGRTIQDLPLIGEWVKRIENKDIPDPDDDEDEGQYLMRDFALTRRLMSRAINAASPVVWAEFCNHTLGR